MIPSDRILGQVGCASQVQAEVCIHGLTIRCLVESRDRREARWEVCRRVRGTILRTREIRRVIWDGGQEQGEEDLVQGDREDLAGLGVLVDFRISSERRLKSGYASRREVKLRLVKSIGYEYECRVRET